MSSRVGLLIAFVLCLAVAQVALADAVVLKDGTKLQGEILQQDEQSVTILLKDGHTQVTMEMDKVQKVEKEEVEEAMPLEKVLVSPPPKLTPVPTQAPVATGSATPGATGKATSVSVGGKPPVGARGMGWSLESMLPEDLRNSQAATAIVLGGLVVMTPLVSIFLWGIAYLVKIEDPTLLKSLATVLGTLGIFLIGYMALQNLYVGAALDTYVVLLVVAFVLAVMVARAIYRTSFVQAFFLWTLPVSIVVAVAYFLGRLKG